MCRTLDRLKQLSHVVVAQAWRKFRLYRRDAEWLPTLPLGIKKPQSQKVVDGCLQRDAGASHLLLQETHYIVIYG